MAHDRKFWLTALAVAGIFLFALFVRTYWNVDPATPDGTFVLSESDAYFHHHSAERIQTEGWRHPIQEPLVNYPLGGVNPNPPLWTWWIATWGALTTPFFAGDAQNHETACPASAEPSQETCVSTWWVTLFSPALFGALTVLLVVLIGREVWGWRAGLLAGFLAATSTSHIERSVLGFADHDSFVLFFIVLSFLFFIKALKWAREERWVNHWGDMDHVRGGLGRYWQGNQISLAFAAMAGVALAGVHLSWKGGAYGAGILLAFGLVQVLINQWRQRDSTHIYGAIATTMLVSLLVALPYYANPELRAVSDTLLPLLYIALAWVAIGVLFTAMRDYPFVLVVPAAAGVGLVALLVAFFLAPSVAQTLLGPLVYFKQTQLYTTIAEAHPADFNSVVFGAGIVGFFIALFALPYLVWVNRKTWRPMWTFVAVWAVIAMFMTQSAVRFMFNATPVFALLGGWGAALLVSRLRLETISKNLRGLGGLSRQAIKRAITPMHVVGTLLIALLLVMPNVILAVDAGMPAQFEDRLISRELDDKGLMNTRENRDTTFVGHTFGAFGQGFISDYWRQLFEWLSQRDTDLPAAERPAFLSWWDYGHWALSLGRHPAVADNFQNGFQFAGNFIAAQNETHAVQLLMARGIDLVKAGQGGLTRGQFEAAFRDQGLTQAGAAEAYDQLAAYSYTPHLNETQSLAALEQVEELTGARIRYFAVDVRLFPFDNPNTPGIDFGSIFYAPITLSGNTPEDYVEAVFRTQNPLRVPDSPDEPPQREFTAEEFDTLSRDVRNLQFLGQGTQQYYKYKEPFFNSMFYRAYIGTPVGFASIPPTSCEYPDVQFQQPGERIEGVQGDRLPGISLPAFCMAHFRLVYYNPSVRMLEFTPGATVEGRVTVDGQPLEGAQVVVYDDAGDLLFEDGNRSLTDAFKSQFRGRMGRNLTASDFDVPHDSATTDANGTYRLTAPFSMDRGTTLRAFMDGVEVGNVTLTITREQAEQQVVIPEAQASIEALSGAIEGVVFFDADRNLRFNDGDMPLQGATVSLATDPEVTATTGADGRYRIEGVPPGARSVVVTLDDYEMAQRVEETTAAVPSGGTATRDVPMALARASVGGTVWRDADASGDLGEGEGLRNVRVLATPDFRMANNTAVRETVFSRDNGTLAFDLSPGTYVLRGEHVDSNTTEGFAFGRVLDVAPGTGTVALDLNETELLPATSVTVNLTVERDAGNVTGAGDVAVLFLPAEGGAPAGERTPSTGSLTVQLLPGTYRVHAEGTLDGEPIALPAPLTIVVGEEAVSAEGRLERASA